MNILFVTSWFPSKYHFNNGNFIETHARAFLSQGHSVVVVHEEFSNKIFIPHIHYSQNSGLPTFQVFLPRIFKSQLWLRKRAIDRLLKAYPEFFESVELVQGHVIIPVGPIAHYLASELKVPLYFTEHWSGFLPERKQSISEKDLHQIQVVAKHCKAVIPVSNYLKNAMEQLGIVANYKVVPNPVDTSIYKYEQSAKRSAFTFLHVSSFTKGIKNVDAIMRAFDGLKSQWPECDAQLIIAGDGNLNEVEQTWKMLKSRSDVELKGALSYEEVSKLMRSVHCFVLFSTFETFSLVAAEASCCGLPLIVSDAGALPERVSLELGLAVSSGDEEELTNAMAQMISNYGNYSPSFIHDFAENKYSFEAVVRNYLAIYGL